MKRIPIVFILILLTMMISNTAFGFSQITTDGGIPISWFQDNVNIHANNLSADQQNAVRAAFRTWTNVPTASLSLSFAGSSSTAVVADDSHNVIFFTSSLGSQTIALASSFFYVDNGELVDADLELNSNLAWSTTYEAGKIDLQSVVTHEVGHMFGLGDLSGGGDSEATMYYKMFAGETKKRTLDKDDENGITQIYPESGASQYSISGKVIWELTGEESFAIIRQPTTTFDPSASVDPEQEETTLNGVTVTLSGTANGTSYSSNGYYVFNNISAGSYQVTPSMTGFTFTPSSVSVQIASNNSLREDFSATGDGSTLAPPTNSAPPTSEAPPTDEPPSTSGSPSESSSSSESSGGCYLATYAYGAEDMHVQALTKFRDQTLLTNRWGQTFVSIYYKVSPVIVERLAGLDSGAAAMRSLLFPLAVATSSAFPLIIFLALFVILIVGRIAFSKRQSNAALNR